MQPGKQNVEYAVWDQQLKEQQQQQQKRHV